MIRGFVPGDRIEVTKDAKDMAYERKKKPEREGGRDAASQLSAQVHLSAEISPFMLHLHVVNILCLQAMAIFPRMKRPGKFNGWAFKIGGRDLVDCGQVGLELEGLGFVVLLLVLRFLCCFGDP